MPKTYYESELTGAQIEDALEAIHGVVTPSNNGKVLCIVNGAIAAKSASEWGHGAVLEPLSVAANGDYTPPAGTDGFDSVHVAVPGATLTTKSITQNGTYNASSDNADGYSSVTVNVSGGSSAVVQPLSVTQNGTYNPPSGVDGYAPVTVNVSGGVTPTLYLVSPSELDNYNAANYKEGGLPCSGVMARYSSAPFFTVGSNTFDGSTKPCLYRTNTDICGIIFTHKITGGSYSKLYIKCIVSGTTQTAQRSWLGLLQSCNFANADGWFFEESGNTIIKLTDTDLTPAEINAQQGVVINSTDNKNLLEQTVEVTLPQSDIFVALLNWRCNMYVRELYLL